MSFHEQLNYLIDIIQCTGKELSLHTGISTGAISLYRSGKREPAPDSEQLSRLCEGLSVLAKQRGLDLADEIYIHLVQPTDSKLTVSYERYISNINLLLETLGITYAKLAERLRYDPSQISRYLTGQRKPRNISRFTGEIASLLANSADDTQTAAMARLFLCRPDEIATINSLYERIVVWCGSDPVAPPSVPIDSFLHKLESFDIEEFLRAMHFDDIKIPTVPFSFPVSKNYLGIEAFKECELDFLKATAFSKSNDDVFCYSDMPIAEMSRDTEFAKNYLLGLGVLLKKGLRLHFVHDVHRPFSEMMIGLEAYIPLYMTGLILPYYFQEGSDQRFSHIHKVSGAAFLHGTAINGDHAGGIYTLTQKRDEISCGQKQAKQLLMQAKPLMEIFRSDSAAKFRKRVQRILSEGDRHIVCGGLPLFTISEKLLRQLLLRSNADTDVITQVFQYRSELIAATEALLQNNSVLLEIPLLKEAEYAKHPVSLNISELFLEKDFRCTYQEYAEHLALTKAFANKHPNCRIKVNPNATFRNISFTILPGKCVLISKTLSPSIHYLIRHPEIVKAFEQFIPPIMEQPSNNNAKV